MPKADGGLEGQQAAAAPAQRKHDSAYEVLELAAWLEYSDRALLHEVLGNRRKVGTLAATIGADRRALHKRVARLVRRVRSPLYRFVAAELGRADRRTRGGLWAASAAEARTRRCRAERAGRRVWDHDTQRVALECLLRARPIRQAAIRLGLTLHAVRRHRVAAIAEFQERQAGK